MENILEECTLCPRNCRVNRLKNEKGFCKATSKIRVALINLHKFEEPCISGQTGSGTIFFVGCNLRCKFCQNYKISTSDDVGYEITEEGLAEEMIRLENEGANNINLVTGFEYVPGIIEAIKIARNKGLKLPILYNTSGYESVQTIKMLKGYVDVYLPDFKYYYNELGKELSSVENYFEIASMAIKEMIDQVGSPEFDEDGMIKKGVIIRHLVLPNHIQNSKMVLKKIKEKFGKDCFVSVMMQYFPTYRALEIEEINRKLNEEEFEQIENYIYKLNLKNGYIQYLGENEEQYVPNF